MTNENPVLEMVQPMQDMAVKYTNAWNEVLALNMDMAFDVMMKNFNFAIGMRNTTDMLFEDVLKGQQRLVTEMVQSAQDYAARMPEMFTPPGTR